MYSLLKNGLAVDDLHARLQKVADARVGSPDLTRPSLSFKSNATEPESALQEGALLREAACHRGLVSDGARPIYSVEEMAQIRAAPLERYKDVLAWLTEEPDFESEDGPMALSGILQEQWDRWWCFRKSQWISRGLGDSEAGERAFCEADKSRAIEGEVRWASSPRFNNFSQTRWRLFMPRERLRPLGDDTFATYSNDVRIRVAPYLFKKPMQLKKDPQKQTAWTNWLEYLSYELRSLESWTAAADALESRYQRSTKKLGDALPSVALEIERFLYGSAFGPPDLQQGFPPASEDSEQTDPTATRLRLNASQDAIRSFLEKTEKYTERRRRAFYQGRRVKWIVKEARLMEVEMAQQSRAGTKRKRKQEEDAAESQQQPPNKIAAPDAPRRSTRLSARRDKSSNV